MSQLSYQTNYYANAQLGWGLQIRMGPPKGFVYLRGISRSELGVIAAVTEWRIMGPLGRF